MEVVDVDVVEEENDTRRKEEVKEGKGDAFSSCLR